MAATTVSRALRLARRQFLSSSGRFQSPVFAHQDAVRLFHATTRWAAIKPFLLADVGEGAYFDLEPCKMILQTHSSIQVSLKSKLSSGMSSQEPESHSLTEFVMLFRTKHQ